MAFKGATMDDLEEFLKRNVEGYLFSDLKVMQGIPVTYPLLMSTFAGMELLGELLATKKMEGREYFVEYWSKYMYPSSSLSGAGDSLYTLVRIGIMHCFAPRGPIAVSRDGAEPLRAAGDVVIVDAVRLANDFVESYEVRVKPLVRATGGEVSGMSMAARFQGMKNEWGRKAKRALDPAHFSIAPVMTVDTAISQSLGAEYSSTMATPPAASPAGPPLTTRLTSRDDK